MNLQPRRIETRVQVPLSWEVLHRKAVSETDFVLMIGQLPLSKFLPVLITLLQYGDASEPPSYETLDRRVRDLFPTEKARRIVERLSRENVLIFFSKWQLLFAIKLLCTFGSRDAGNAKASDDQFLDLLLMTNGFYPRAESALDTAEDLTEAVQRLALLGHSLIQHEQPNRLIGRYSELFGRLAASANQSEFNSWVDIQKAFAAALGVHLDAFKAVLFLLYSKSIVGTSWPKDGSTCPQLGCLIPEHDLADMRLPREELDSALGLVSTSPDEIREEHQSECGDRIGNPVDLGILLRNPAIALNDGRLAGISGQLLIQRYTCGLYWDLHDALPDDAGAAPNRRSFQTFFGELHERYGSDTLQRIRDDQVRAKRRIRLLLEKEYESGSGPNPDSLIVETIGRRNTRCTLFEFKVGRPRYKDSILGGNVHAFQDDVRRKIEDGLEQETGFCRQLQNAEREIPDLLTRDITAWLFVIVVTDPFPAMGLLLEQLRRKLADSPGLVNVRRYGPFILSLAELEQLETLPKSRVSQLLIDWDSGPDRDWPFNTFYAHRTKNGPPIPNDHVSKLAHDDLERVPRTLFGRSIHPH